MRSDDFRPVGDGLRAESAGGLELPPEKRGVLIPNPTPEPKPFDASTDDGIYTWARGVAGEERRGENFSRVVIWIDSTGGFVPTPEAWRTHPKSYARAEAL